MVSDAHTAPSAKVAKAAPCGDTDTSEHGRRPGPRLAILLDHAVAPTRLYTESVPGDTPQQRNVPQAETASGPEPAGSGNVITTPRSRGFANALSHTARAVERARSPPVPPQPLSRERNP